MKKTYAISFLLLDKNDLVIRKEEEIKAFTPKQALFLLEKFRYPRKYGYLIRDVKITEKKEKYEQLTLF